MPIGDSRKEFLFTTAGNYFGIPASDDSLTAQQNASVLNDFLDDGSSGVLVITKDGSKVVISNKV